MGENMSTLETNGGIAVYSRIYNLAKKFNSFYLNIVQSWLLLMAILHLNLELKFGSYKPFVIHHYQVGLISPKMLKMMENFPSVFVIEDGFVLLNPALDTYEARSKAVEAFLKGLRDNNAFGALKGWRNECYEVGPGFEANPLMQIERSAACLLGIRQYGIDINGYVNHPTRGLCIWLQKRSLTKQTWPGYYDNIVSGGISVGYTVLETAHKEAEEEASVTGNLLDNLTPVGTVTIFYESERGLSPNTEFVFDLELPIDFKPVNQDGEVESFHLLSAADVLEALLTPNFKTTSAPVLMDFLIRKGVINEKNEPHYEQIKNLLHIPLNSIYKEL